MAKRGSREKTVPVSIDLPEALHGWLAHVAHQKGLTVGEHIRAWIIASLEPWEEPPLPLDAYKVAEIPDEPVHTVPVVLTPADNRTPRREDFATAEEFAKAERAERNARGLETRLQHHCEHIRKIAEARAQHPRMPLRQFAQLLFDLDIYKSNDNGYAQPTPMNTRLLSRWLREAAELDILPKACLPGLER